ncbi:hypothetical protein H2198_000587 [Neophaeococcomyces mojaviensis]|uniref:Uncharacterized protein n=1 Tax=Neophaeococcomyces mojaviensis TaxID=3383035 RepID=A0ACC3AJU7_9EURO|nr:hypothetical protein H2198_000587 [Knufia sp. JES_112]
MAIQAINPPNHPPLAPTYSHLTIATTTPSSKLIHISGQIGVDPANPSATPDLASQVRLALSNLDRCLEAAGATKKDLVLTRQYMVKMGSLSPDDFRARADIYIEWLGGIDPPAEVLVGVDSMAVKEMLFEVEAVVVVG